MPTPTQAGKTWLEVLWTAQAINDGLNVLILDPEDNEDGTVGRLVMLPGMTPEKVIKHLTYIPVSGPMPKDFDKMYPDENLIFIDGIAQMLGNHGLEDDAKGFLWMNTNLIKPLAATGAAVASNDHAPLSNDARPIGTVHKLTAITGSSYVMRNIKPFGEGISGYSELWLDKDRGGKLRKECAEKKWGRLSLIGELHVNSKEIGGDEYETKVKLREPGTSSNGYLSVSMERVSKHMASVDKPQSKNAICNAVGGNKDSNLEAINELLKLKHVEYANPTATYPKIKHVSEYHHEW